MRGRLFGRTTSSANEEGVWPTSTKIDVYRENQRIHEITIYEIKVERAEPQHVYQLRMYWDGLVLNHKQPTEAWLMAQDYDAKIEEMVRLVNDMPPPFFPATNGQPATASAPYHIILKRLGDLGLMPPPSPVPSTADTAARKSARRR